MRHILLIALVIYFWPNSQVQAKARLYTQTEYIMGTLFTIKIQTQEAPLPYFDAAFKILREYDLVLSDYRQDSERSYVLQQDPRKKTKLSARFCHALLWSQYFSVITDGAFDITIGPLMRLWGVHSQAQHQPSWHEIKQSLKKSGFEKIDPTGCYLQRQHAAIEMDFGGIGKGLALDAAVRKLKQMGVRIAALEAGQSTHYFMGAPFDSPQGWPVRLRTQQNAPPYYLKNKAISSSGDEHLGFEIAGEKYSHIINPQTGTPLRSRASVTVIADDAMTADAMSTAFMVLPQSSGPFYEQSLNIHVIYNVLD